MLDLGLMLIEKMASHLENSSERLAFVQARVSAEALVQYECAYGAHLAVGETHHIHMEKVYRKKKVDLLIIPNGEVTVQTKKR